MSNDIKIVRYSKQYEEKHIEFASKYWTKKRRLSPEYINWKFRLHEKKNNTFLLAIDGDKVIGQLGLIICSYKVDDTVFTAQWCCDLMLDVGYRGKGIAKKLYQHAHKLKDVSFGSDPSIAAFRSMKKMGYIPIQSSWKIIFTRSIGEIFKLKKIDYKLLNALPNPFLLFIKVFENSHKYSQVSKDEYIKLIKNTNVKGIHYNDSFLKWRLNKFDNWYPGIDCFKYKDNFFSGYLSGTTYFIVVTELDGVLDYLKMISFILGYYRNIKNLRIRFFCNEDKISTILMFLGFVKFRTQTQIIFFTENHKIKQQLLNDKFKYGYLDSDENI